MDADPPESTIAPIPTFGLRREMRNHSGNFPNGRAAWPEWVETAYFLIWMKAGCDAKLAVQQAEALWPAFTDEPFQPVPLRTIQGWAQRHNWHQKATQTVAGIYPQIHMDTTAKVALSANKASEVLLAAMHGAYAEMDAKKERNLIEWTKLALIGGGAGTFGTRDRVAQPVRNLAVDTEVDFSAMTAQELARWEADAIAKSRNTDPERRKR